jgi:hypothetical protein
MDVNLNLVMDLKNTSEWRMKKQGKSTEHNHPRHSIQERPVLIAALN